MHFNSKTMHTIATLTIYSCHIKIVELVYQSCGSISYHNMPLVNNNLGVDNTHAHTHARTHTHTHTIVTSQAYTW